MALNERVVEIPWLLSLLGRPQQLLDVGACDAAYLADLVATGAAVTGIDTRPFQTSGMECLVCDAAAMPEQWSGRFDLVTCVSVLDHVGLDAYGNIEQPGQLERAAAELWRVTAPGGRLLVTMPYGRAQLTTHPGGGQRVFDYALLLSLFGLWCSNETRFWKRHGDEYRPASRLECAGADYDDYRADAVIALELEKIL